MPTLLFGTQSAFLTLSSSDHFSKAGEKAGQETYSPILQMTKLKPTEEPHCTPIECRLFLMEIVNRKPHR